MSESGGNDPLDDHPAPELLERFMRNELAGAERRRVVRHLLGGACPRCAALTRELWVLGDPASRRRRPRGEPVAPQRPDDLDLDARDQRLLGQTQAALGLLADAETTLSAAAAALARQGLGREAALAQVELGRVLARAGRAGDLQRLGLDRQPPLFPRDASWQWTSALLVFQSQVHSAPDDLATLDALADYLALPPRPARAA